MIGCGQTGRKESQCVKKCVHAIENYWILIVVFSFNATAEQFAICVCSMNESY